VGTGNGDSDVPELSSARRYSLATLFLGGGGINKEDWFSRFCGWALGVRLTTSPCEEKFDENLLKKNKKFCEVLICLLFPHKFTVNNIKCHHLHTKFNPNPPIGSKVSFTSEV
jgi:hypothetical protein